MAVTFSDPQSTGNLFLDAIPARDRARFLKGATQEDLPARRVLFEPGQQIDHVYFPTGGVVSLVTVMNDGGIVEMATIGREGIVGVPMVLDGRSTANAQAVSQVEGHALVVPAGLFIECVTRGGPFSALVYEYLHALFTAVGQNAACNRMHSMTERCARWLLMTNDRVGADTFGLTHEYLSQMLGARRASVTEAAQQLQNLNAITYRRGIVEIVDRSALESEACECYVVIKRAFDSLFQMRPLSP